MTLPGWIRSRWWALPMLVIAAFALFWPVLGLSLLSDDHVAVWRTGVQGWAWRTGFFRPLADLTIRWGGLLHGPDAMGYRIFNVALHGVNTWLVLLLGRQWLGPTRGPWAGWMAAVLFLASRGAASRGAKLPGSKKQTVGTSIARVSSHEVPR